MGEEEREKMEAIACVSNRVAVMKLEVVLPAATRLPPSAVLHFLATAAAVVVVVVVVVENQEP